MLKHPWGDELPWDRVVNPSYKFQNSKKRLSALFVWKRLNSPNFQKNKAESRFFIKPSQVAKSIFYWLWKLNSTKIKKYQNLSATYQNLSVTFYLFESLREEHVLDILYTVLKWVKAKILLKCICTKRNVVWWSKLWSTSTLGSELESRQWQAVDMGAQILPLSSYRDSTWLKA